MKNFNSSAKFVYILIACLSVFCAKFNIKISYYTRGPILQLCSLGSLILVLVYEGEVREYGSAEYGVNSDMFTAAQDRGDVKIIVNGHDHINN